MIRSGVTHFQVLKERQGRSRMGTWGQAGWGRIVPSSTISASLVCTLFFAFIVGALSVFGVVLWSSCGRPVVEQDRPLHRCGGCTKGRKLSLVARRMAQSRKRRQAPGVTIASLRQWG